MDARDYSAMTGGNRKPTVFIEREDCDEEHELPTRYEVCPLCQGKGTHVNPGIDAHGLTAEDFYEDPDFAEDYFRGRYDQICNECHGERVVEVVDREHCPADLTKGWVAA